MRRDLCAHAGGELLKQLQELGIEVPPQDEGLVTAEGTVVQVRNTAEGDGRQAPNTRHDEDARFTEMTRRIASLHNDVRYLDASFTVIANFVGLSRDEVVSAATQLLLHGGVAGNGTKTEAGGNKHAPRTPQRPSARKRRDDSSPEEDGVRNLTQVALAPPGPDVWGDRLGQETAKADEEEDLVSDSDDEDGGEDTSATRYTGVKLDPNTGKYCVKILFKERGKRKQQRLGGYTTEEEAAFAYAAGAFVLRPSERIPNTVSLSAAEKATLRGCTKEDLQTLVEARKWWRWRSWREALESVGQRLKRVRKRGGATGASKRRRVVDHDHTATNDPAATDNAESGGTAPVTNEQGGGARDNDQEERREDTGAEEKTSEMAA
ncbi:unnamed protein product [Closterium sp. NIES-65]|nr:unnamed protein product [Closterium sp. NIES-65]